MRAPIIVFLIMISVFIVLAMVVYLMDRFRQIAINERKIDSLFDHFGLTTGDTEIYKVTSKEKTHQTE